MPRKTIETPRVTALQEITFRHKAYAWLKQHGYNMETSVCKACSECLRRGMSCGKCTGHDLTIFGCNAFHFFIVVSRPIQLLLELCETRLSRHMRGASLRHKIA